jgi:hypothetical protein
MNYLGIVLPMPGVPWGWPGQPRLFFQIKGEMIMKGKVHILSVIIFLILTGLLLVPALAQADTWSEMHKQHRATLVKELKLSPDKAKDFNAVEDKYARERTDIIAGIKKAHNELQAAMGATNPDEAKLKELVSALTTGQDKMFASFKNQRDEELALMTPAEQAKYLIKLGQWRQKMMEQHKAAGEKK